MADNLKRFYKGQPGTSDTTLYTVPSAKRATIKHIRIVNPTGSAATIKLGINGVADADLILPTTSIDAGGSAECDSIYVLDATDTLRAIAGTATAINVTVHGLEQDV